MLRFADTNAPIFSYIGMNNSAVGEILARAENRPIEIVEETCDHCGKPGADTNYEDSIVGVMYAVHTHCRLRFRLDIEAATRKAFYGES